jgi:hypothetical protein
MSIVKVKYIEISNRETVTSVPRLSKAAFGMADNDRYLPIMAIINNVHAFGMPNHD